MRVSEGEYELRGHSFTTQDGVKFVIRERKNQTEKKPKSFLVSLEGGMFKYVSSLYPTKDGIFKFDFDHVIYTLKLDGSRVEIHKEDSGA